VISTNIFFSQINKSLLILIITQSLHYITLDFIMISSRCAEPSRLKGMKLRQINPEFLCKEKTGPTGKPQGDQTYPTNPVQPIPIRTKPDATTSCHTYLFPQVRMDCSKRGKFTNSFFLYMSHKLNLTLSLSTYVSDATGKNTSKASCHGARMFMVNILAA